MMVIILLFLYFAQNPDQMIPIGDRIRMLRPKFVLTNVNCFLAKGLCLCIVTLSKREFCQIIEPFSGCRML